jgi:indole-3-glycerol phosphate synthase
VYIDLASCKNLVGPFHRISQAIVHHNIVQVESGAVTIRRRPPRGVDKQPCGPVDFKVKVDEDNKPRNILEEIVWYKAVEVEKWRERMPAVQLRSLLAKAEKARDFRGAILQKLEEYGKPGLIAEVKKASPSRGVIQADFDPVKIAKGYEAGGAACLSVLTDEKFFQGSFHNLTAIRTAGVECPLLCKDFIVDAYQILKARASGADCILLIAAVLPNQDIAYFMKAAMTLGMICLIEVHSEAELQRVLRVDGIDNHILGINNRNLETFEVSNTMLGISLCITCHATKLNSEGVHSDGEVHAIKFFFLVSDACIVPHALDCITCYS